MNHLTMNKQLIETNGSVVSSETDRNGQDLSLLLHPLLRLSGTGLGTNRCRTE